MKFVFTDKKVNLPNYIHNYAEKKVGKLDRFFKEDATAALTFSIEKDRNQVEVTIRSSGTIFRVSESTSDMHASIDAAVTTLERQIRKNKTRLAKNLRAEAVLPELPEEFEATRRHVRHRAHQALHRQAHERGGSHFADEPAGPQLLRLPQHRFRRCDLRRLSPQQRRLRHHRDRGRRGVSRSESI